jgi:outer membrane protein assembly factor BamA
VRGLPWVLAAFLLLSACDDTARISGNRAVSDGDLEWAARGPLASWRTHQRPADLVDAAESMRNRLDDQGYVWANVEGGPPLVDDADRLPVFTVEEGPRVRIGVVEFKGDTALPVKQLRQLTRLERWYTSDGIKAAPRRLVRGLRLAGYLTARVPAPTVRWTPGRDIADLTFHVAAGPRFTLAAERLQLEGEQSLRVHLLVLLDGPGAVCHPRMAGEAAARVRGWLVDHGYREAQVEATQRLDIDTATMEVDLVVRTGPRHILTGVTVQGGRRTQRAFIDRQARELRVGQPLSQGALDQTVSALTLTGLYRRVQSETIAGEPLPDGSIPTEVRLLLREDPNQRVDLSAGFGSYEQLRGGIEYVDEHLLGRGLRFNTGVDASLKGWGGDIGLADPYLLGAGRRIGIELAYSEREEPSFSHQESSATLGVTQRMRPLFDPAAYELRTAYRYAYSKDYDVTAPLAGEEEDGSYITSSIGADLRRDTRMPKIIDPETGTLALVGFRVSAKPLGAEVEYFELSTEWSAAINPAPWLVATVHAGASTRDPIDSNSLPIGERLFLGGEDTVRSFTKDDLGPRDVNGQPLGGLTRAVANLELRWRPWRNRRNIEIATFYDIGMVHHEPWTIGGPVGHGVGLGLRYRTPVGPIRLDAAYDPFDRLGAEDPWAVHLAVGFAF